MQGSPEDGRKSDGGIVAVKQGNACGAKAAAENRLSKGNIWKTEQTENWKLKRAQEATTDGNSNRDSKGAIPQIHTS